MIYLFFAAINTIYGTLLLLTLSADTPGFFLVLAIGGILTILGLSGFVLWIKMVINVNHDESPDDDLLKNWFGLVRSFDIVLVLGLIFRAVVIQPFVIEGSSMEQNFHNKQILLVDKISYRFKDPQRGDVVIFQYPKNPREDYIKRVIAIPGETIVINQGKVYINGFLLEEPYLNQATQTNDSASVFRKTMGVNEYFVMGDNRSNSSDSREWGLLPKFNIIGQAWMSVYPWNTKGLLKFPPSIIDRSQVLKNLTSMPTLTKFIAA